MNRLTLIVLSAAAVLSACSTVDPAPAATSANWIGVWGASPAPPPSTAKTFENETVRQVVRLSAGGRQVRIRFTNEYGLVPLVIGAATIAHAGADGAVNGAPVAITFSGASSVTIPRGAPFLSDPVDLPVNALDKVSISIFLPGSTGLCTCHPLATATSEVSPKGDFTRATFAPASTFINRAFISAVEAIPAQPSRGVVVAFGDSITDGYRSTPDGDKRWPDILAARLTARGPGWAVVNEAISGNRVLGFEREIFGDAALARFDRDVLSVPGLTHMIILEGVNDIGMGGDKRPTPDQMIAGYKQLIARAHDKGVKIYGGTIIPFKGAAYYTEAGETVRQAVNTWIRTSNAFDGVVDFDAVMRDPTDPLKMPVDLQSGDWLHPNDAGYTAMGAAVDLALFN
jgi:lysophospholipase L1-like esterase